MNRWCQRQWCRSSRWCWEPAGAPPPPRAGALPSAERHRSLHALRTDGQGSGVAFLKGHETRIDDLREQAPAAVEADLMASFADRVVHLGDGRIVNPRTFKARQPAWSPFGGPGLTMTEACGSAET